MQFEPIEPAQHIKLDLFPARITTSEQEPSLLHKDCRLVITDSHYYVFKETTTDFEVAESGPISDFQGSNASGWSISAPETQDFTVFRDANCGCGSRLRGFHPFPGVPHAPYIPRGYEGRF